MIREFGIWAKTPCDECGEEFHVTRTEPAIIDWPVLCESCESYLLGYKAGLAIGRKEGTRKPNLDRTCPKCGSNDLSLLYHAEGDNVGKSRKIKDEVYVKRTLNFLQEFIGLVANREFLSIHCRTCQYYWEEPPLDAEED